MIRQKWERCALEEEGLWESDVRSYRPTAAVIMFGMNDAGSSIFKLSQSADELEQKKYGNTSFGSRDSYDQMLDKLQALQVDSIGLITSSLYDQTMMNPSAKNVMRYGVGKNDLIRRMSREVIDVEASQRQLEQIDFNTPMDALNQKQQMVDPAFSIIGNDRVHPGAAGHMVMTYLFLKAQSLEGAVAHVEVDVIITKFNSVLIVPSRHSRSKKGEV